MKRDVENLAREVREKLVYFLVFSLYKRLIGPYRLCFEIDSHNK
jgi:mRNA-degrading endonuclease RelE of RelBE toxin-antitoxin system